MERSRRESPGGSAPTEAASPFPYTHGGNNDFFLMPYNKKKVGIKNYIQCTLDGIDLMGKNAKDVCWSTLMTFRVSHSRL